MNAVRGRETTEGVGLYENVLPEPSAIRKGPPERLTAEIAPLGESPPLAIVTDDAAGQMASNRDDVGGGSGGDMSLAIVPVPAPATSNGDGTGAGSGSGSGTPFGPPAPTTRRTLRASFEDAVTHGPDSLPGLVGLSNLGNTCYMNSSLQCLLHTVPLMRCFLSGAYVADINEANPLGQGGELARSFGSLMGALWRPGVQFVTPRSFKAKIGHFCHVFSGYGQQDSQELLAFLLDGLHEDLNRIKKKPYIEEDESADTLPDDALAAKQWAAHRARNDSLVVDHCLGLYRSKLVCPRCNHVSRKFDPVMYLSLPLPESRMRTFRVTLVWADGSRAPQRVAAEVPSVATVIDLLGALARIGGVPHTSHTSAANSRATSTASLEALAESGGSGAAGAAPGGGSGDGSAGGGSGKGASASAPLPPPPRPQDVMLLAKVSQAVWRESVELFSDPRTRVSEISINERAYDPQSLVCYVYPSAHAGPANASLSKVWVHHRKRRGPAAFEGKMFCAPLLLLLPPASATLEPRWVTQETGVYGGLEYAVDRRAPVAAAVHAALAALRTDDDDEHEEGGEDEVVAGGCSAGGSGGDEVVAGGCSAGGSGGDEVVAGGCSAGGSGADAAVDAVAAGADGDSSATAVGGTSCNDGGGDGGGAGGTAASGGVAGRGSSAGIDATCNRGNGAAGPPASADDAATAGVAAAAPQGRVADGCMECDLPPPPQPSQPQGLPSALDGRRLPSPEPQVPRESPSGRPASPQPPQPPQPPSEPREAQAAPAAKEPRPMEPAGPHEMEPAGPHEMEPAGPHEMEPAGSDEMEFAGSDEMDFPGRDMLEPAGPHEMLAFDIWDMMNAGGMSDNEEAAGEEPDAGAAMRTKIWDQLMFCGESGNEEAAGKERGAGAAQRADVSAVGESDSEAAARKERGAPPPRAAGRPADYVLRVSKPGRTETGFGLLDDIASVVCCTGVLIVDWPEPAPVGGRRHDLSLLESPAQHDSHVAAERVSRQGRAAVSLGECFDAFLQPEQLSEDDSWYCPQCKDHVEADKKLDLWHLPEVLVVHLKRFCFTRTHREKITTRVDFPLVGLDLSKHLMRPQGVAPVYDCYAVSNHFGSLGGGHYTAYCKMPGSDRWHCFDDSSVSAADESDVCSAAAYVLFYRRRCDAAADPPGLVDELVAARAQADREAAAAAATAGPGAEAVALAESEQDANLLGVGAAVAAARTTRRRANSSSSTELSVLNDSDYLADGLGDMDSGDDSWPRPDRRGGSGGGTSAAVRPRKGKSGAAHAGTMRPRESDAPAWMLNFGNPVLRRSSSSRPVSAGGSGGGLHIAADTMEGIQRTGSGGGGSSGVGSPCGADADSTGAAVDIACGDNGDECGSRGGGRKDGDWVHLEMMSTSP